MSGFPIDDDGQPMSETMQIVFGRSWGLPHHLSDDGGEGWVEALRGYRHLRDEIWANHWWHLSSEERERRPSIFPSWPPVRDSERDLGIPEGWYGR